ncbi:MAG: response regulator [Bacteroidetes bacterium]|nr:response regulator [Bacteroidota bacterium]
MVKSHLKSVLSARSGVPTLLQNLCQQNNDWLCVEDLEGRLLFGEMRSDSEEKRPIFQEGELVGWVHGQGMTEVAAGMLTQLATKESEKKKIGAEALNLYREINLIYDFSEKLVAATSPTYIARMALEEASSLIKFESAAVVLWDNELKVSNIVAQTGSLFFTNADLRESDHFMSSIVTNGQTQIIDNQQLVIVYASLKVKHRIMGSILLVRDGGAPFTAADLKLLTTLAQQSAAAIETLLLLEVSVWNSLELKREKQETENIRSLSNLKSQFFTNIAHEFRTPLTVILGMSDELKNSTSQTNAANQVELIDRNSRGLLRLINQLLDLSKLEAGSFQLNPVQTDLVVYLQYLLESFRGYASNQRLTLNFKCPLDDLPMDFDPDQLGQVVSNLLSNAIKFTPPGGRVELKLNMDGQPNHSLNPQTAIISVSDTGQGIPKADQPHIFDRFYQVAGTKGGSGIGLAYVRELLKLMGGSISVESAVGFGTEMTVRLPIQQQAEWQNPTVFKVEDKSFLANTQPEARQSDLPSENGATASELPLLLIVEDNPDIVTYLQTCLGHIYQIDVAYNGSDGIEKAIEIIPDIIISDVMMPFKDGYELTDTLKHDHRTSHIPIVLLTAKADVQSKIEGLRSGADAYLPKPFDKEELLIRLEKLIELRKRLKERFMAQIFSQNEASVELENIEDAFMQQLKTILAENISDETFALPELCKKIGMSRSQLFRKMKALSDESPSGFIRSYRLHRAKEMLSTSDLSISEIGYEVGFKNPAHFSKTFHDEFGVPPSDLRN